MYTIKPSVFLKKNMFCFFFKNMFLKKKKKLCWKKNKGQNGFFQNHLFSR